MVEVENQEESQGGQEKEVEYAEREELLALRAEVQELQSAVMEEINRVRAEMEGKLKSFERRVSQDRKDIDRGMEVLKELNHRVSRISKKLRHISEEIGLEEELDVNKVPANILESVYQYTLDDAVRAMRHMLGVHDAEREVQNILEEVRFLTSGTELFRYVDGWIKIRGIAKAIETGMISAKQIHITYTELLRKIQERIPGYRPKNFRALIKTKGQEFAIDRTTENTKHILQLETVVERLRLDMQRTFLRLDQQQQELESLRRHLSELDTEFAALRDSVDSGFKKMEEMLSLLGDAVEVLREDMRSIKEISRAEEAEPPMGDTDSLLLNSIPPSGISLEDLQEMFSEFMEPNEVAEALQRLKETGHVVEGKGKLFSLPVVKEEVLESIPDGGISYSSLRRSFSWLGEAFDVVIGALREEGRVMFKEYGKGKRVFRTLVEEENGGD
jgi:chromosome segregation ATPase